MKLYKLLMLTLASVGIFACSESPEMDEHIKSVTTFELPESENQLNRSFNGVAKAHDLVELAFRVDGKIEDILVSKGENVKQGQLLAVLDKNDYQVAINDQKSTVERTKKMLDRAEVMLSKALMAQAEFDTIKAEYLVANADYKQAKLALQYTELKAPFDGVVGDIFLDAFENVQPGVAILSMHRVNFIEVEVQIPDQILAITKQKGMHNTKFNVSFNAYPEIDFKGNPYEMNLVKDPITRSYLATLLVEIDKNYKILQGMPARVELDLGEITHTSQREYLIPISAVRSLDSEPITGQISHVFIYDKNSQRVVATQVELGTIINNYIEVKSGLNSGDHIVVDGSAVLVDGQQVNINKEQK